MSVTGYDNGDSFLKALSSFWTVVYEDRAVLQKFMSGYGELFSEAYFSFLETVLGKSIDKIPVFDKKKWFFLTFKESDNLSNKFLEYSDDEIVYGPQPKSSIFTENKEFDYGGNLNSSELFKFKLPDKMVSIDRFLMNRIHSPSLVMTKGVEFTVNSNDKTITFTKNPFNNKLVSIREIKDINNKVVDRELGIWSLNSFWDYEYVWRNFGSLVGFKKPSSEEYKTFVKAIWELFLGGPNFDNVEAGINAILGLPICRDDEVIQDIIYEKKQNVIITDLRIYKLSKKIPLKATFFSSTGLLKPNIALKKFSSFTDVVTIKDRISAPKWWRDVDPLLIPSNFTNGDNFLLPKDVVVYADMKIGATWGLPKEHKVPSEAFRTLGLKVGEWVIGKESNGNPLSYKLDYKDFIMEKYFQENIFFLSIKPANLVQSLVVGFENQITQAIYDSIPAYCAFINYTFLDIFTEDFEPDNQTGSINHDVNVSTLWDGQSRIKGHNSDYEVLDIGTGPDLSEVAKEKNDTTFNSTTDLGYEDGSVGAPFTGFIIVGGFSVGKIGFQSNLCVVRSECGS